MAQATEKIIAAIGASDEDVAHLRLLMRKAVKELTDSWRWGSEVGADLVVIDVGEFSGQMARTRAQAAGVRVAILCSAGADAEGDLALQRPFTMGNVVEVLNQVTAAGDTVVGIEPQVADFYFGSEPEPTSVVPRAPLAHGAPARSASPPTEVAMGLDELIRGDPLIDPFASMKLPRVDEEAVGASDGSEPTRRSDSRHSRDPDKKAAPSSSTHRLLPASKRSIGEDRTQHPLRAYLTGDLLGGPAQIAWAEQPVVTLDPKNQTFHCARGLAALEVYCRESPRRSDWRMLTSGEIMQIREALPAQPYLRLIWLDVLLKSGGKLAVHLDPGGTYRLKRWLEIRRDYPRLSRISTVMMQPLRLHQIVASSGAEMSDVFDVVNAYDAIGWLEWTPRQPRHTEVVNENGLSAFMQKLRKPFGR